MVGLNMFFLILSVILVYLVCNKRVKSLVDKALQVCEIKLDKVLIGKEQRCQE